MIMSVERMAIPQLQLLNCMNNEKELEFFI